MKRTAALLAVLLLVAGAAGAVAADGGPLADAGLDQEVAQNTTVQLDGTGSSHPDGTIDQYDWVLRTPTGVTITPDCRDCARTTFQATEVGRYKVTLTVTDTEDRTDADTLYVYVEEAGPTVTLSGPTTPRVDQPRRYDTTAGTTNAKLGNLTWRVGNRTVATESLSGETDASEERFTFDDEGPYTLEVIVEDTNNRTARDTLVVQPRTPSENDSSDPDSEPPTGNRPSSPSSDSDIGPDGNPDENTRDQDMNCPTTGIGVLRQDSGDVAITCVTPGAGNNQSDGSGGLSPSDFGSTCSESAGDCSWSDNDGDGIGSGDDSNGDSGAEGRYSKGDSDWKPDSGTDWSNNEGTSGSGSSSGNTGFVG